MGAPSAQVQSPQSSQPASKNAGQSASSEPGTGKGGQMSSMSGQPQMGEPNTNGNTELAPVNANFVAPINGPTNSNPYPKTVGIDQQTDNPMDTKSRPMGKGSSASNTASSGKA